MLSPRAMKWFAKYFVFLVSLLLSHIILFIFAFMSDECFILKYLFIWKSGRNRERVPPLVQSPDGCSGQGCARQKPWMRSLFHVYHVWGRSPNIRAISCCFSQALTGSWIKVEQPGYEPVSSPHTFFKSVIDIV